MGTSTDTNQAMRELSRNILLLTFSCFFTIGLIELLLPYTGLLAQPLKPHSYPPQFQFIPGEDFGYVNKPTSSIEFVYDGNPRNYFGSRNEVVHKTNAIGFRGPLFARENKSGKFRIAFLGDSFTFGEGVHFEDTYPHKIGSLLQSTGRPVESLNFGVGGYNTRQEASLYKSLAGQSNPDLLILGYTMNDAEPALFYYDEASKRYRRRPREREVGSVQLPPDHSIFQFRSAQLVWERYASHKQTHNTIRWYRSLYEADKPGWKATQAALSDIGSRCKSAGITCAAVLFPLLFQLDDYPLRAEHNLVKQVMKENGFLVIDVLPLLEDMDTESLWVHPTDKHPNEIVHAIVAKAVVARLGQEDINWHSQIAQIGGKLRFNDSPMSLGDEDQ